ncbi:hypothetical protein [Paenibacillus arenosi]|uniref:Uncharacterized protein n=1 Tax=Paenibacillus arenosi TaxID=2774142 RepID=A0ABR9B3B6_9BACL|nr:hypothetical protein [Paenibacillus arenosi]MBD8500850.1 hypothetical protein [Paenibacillus arenosi]
MKLKKLLTVLLAVSCLSIVSPTAFAQPVESLKPVTKLSQEENSSLFYGHYWVSNLTNLGYMIQVGNYFNIEYSQQTTIRVFQQPVNSADANKPFQTVIAIKNNTTGYVDGWIFANNGYYQGDLTLTPGVHSVLIQNSANYPIKADITFS